jgi:hypothetical protein
MNKTKTIDYYRFSLELPEHMKNDAKKWGMNDTPWRDTLHMWYKENKMNN